MSDHNIGTTESNYNVSDAKVVPVVESAPSVFNNRQILSHSQLNSLMGDRNWTFAEAVELPFIFEHGKKELFDQLQIERIALETNIYIMAEKWRQNVKSLIVEWHDSFINNMIKQTAADFDACRKSLLNKFYLIAQRLAGRVVSQVVTNETPSLNSDGNSGTSGSNASGAAILEASDSPSLSLAEEKPSHPMVRASDGASHPMVRASDGASHPMVRASDGASHPMVRASDGASSVQSPAVRDKVDKKKKKNPKFLDPKHIQVMNDWAERHWDRPYPSREDKLEIIEKTGLKMNQVKHWFVNFRHRVWIPKNKRISEEHSSESRGEKKSTSERRPRSRRQKKR